MKISLKVSKYRSGNIYHSEIGKFKILELNSRDPKQTKRNSFANDLVFFRTVPDFTFNVQSSVHRFDIIDSVSQIRTEYFHQFSSKSR